MKNNILGSCNRNYLVREMDNFYYSEIYANIPIYEAYVKLLNEVG